MKNYVKKFIEKCILAERSPKKLTLAVCMGTWIAFSPFWGIHTVLIFLTSWLFRLNFTVVFSTGYLLNNPWTMFPIFGLNYLCGHYILDTYLGLNLIQYNPSFMGWFNEKVGPYITKYMGLHDLSFWTFIIGGVLSATIIAFLAYPLLHPFFKRAARVYHKDDT